MGDIEIKLYNETPIHKANFIQLVKDKTLDGTLFHRVIKGFMIQGGDPDSKNASPGQQLGSGGLGFTIPAEFNPKFIHKKGALAAARTGGPGNPHKESSSTQFYLCQGKTYTKAELDAFVAQRGKSTTYSAEQYKAYATVGGTPHLDGEYTVFGEVVKGLEIIDKIAAVATGRGDRPKTDIKMTLTFIK